MADVRMEPEEFKYIRDRLGQAAALILSLDLAAFSRELNIAESITPIVDPTFFIKNSHWLEQNKRLTRAALEFQKAIKEIAEDQLKRIGGS